MSKEDILKQELSNEELDSINGGRAVGCGGCTETYYDQQCTATVEEGSWCGNNDFCKLIVQHYWHDTGRS